jgi:hypothetical protein
LLREIGTLPGGVVGNAGSAKTVIPDCLALRLTILKASSRLIRWSVSVRDRPRVLHKRGWRFVRLPLGLMIYSGLRKIDVWEWVLFGGFIPVPAFTVPVFTRKTH